MFSHLPAQRAEEHLIGMDVRWVTRAAGQVWVAKTFGFRDCSEVHRARPGSCHFQICLACILAQPTAVRDIHMHFYLNVDIPTGISPKDFVFA